MAEYADYRITDPVQVSNIVCRFMELQLHEIKRYQPSEMPYADWFTEQIIEVENLDTEITQYMDFMDIFCLIEHIPNNPEYETTMKDGSPCSPQMTKFSHYRWLFRYLQYAYKSAIPIKLFLSLTVKSFYGFLKSASSGNSQIEMYDEYDRIRVLLRSFMENYTEGTFDEETTTIKRVLDAISNTIGTVWCPTYTRITSYQLMIMEAYEMIGRLLIGSFKIAFKHRFHAKCVIEKY